MNNEINLLLIAAATIGLIHTITGPDHYIPFIMMSKSGKWGKIKTLWVTVLCGTGHVLSSVVIGIIGIAAGISLSNLELVEQTRGEIAGWMLIAFGLVYMIWGIKKAYKNKPHSHIHVNEDGTYITHSHKHHGEHVHLGKKKRLTPWVLFVIFVLGPCEPLIPLLMFPAIEQSVTGLILVTLIFGVVTIATMTLVVMLSLWGLNFIPIGKAERYTHAISGFTIFISGLAVNFLGL